MRKVNHKDYNVKKSYIPDCLLSAFAVKFTVLNWFTVSLSIFFLERWKTSKDTSLDTPADGILTH